MALLEQLAELLADLAAARLALFPLVGLDAQRGVGLSVAGPALHVDYRDVECDQHAGVAVPEVVQARLGCGESRELGGAHLSASRATLRSRPLPLRLANTNAAGLSSAPRSPTSATTRRISCGGMSIAVATSSVFSGARSPSSRLSHTVLEKSVGHAHHGTERADAGRKATLELSAQPRLTAGFTIDPFEGELE
jgi:hypothetical protein